MEYKKKLIGAIFSILLHLFLVLALIHTSKIEKHKKKLYPPGSEVIHLLPLEQSKINNKPKKSPGDPATIHERTCEHGIQYKGVGLQYTIFDMKIIQIAAGSPAYNAGLKVGDQILDMTLGVTEDGYVNLTINRNDIITNYHIKAEMICYSKETLKP